MNYSVEIPAKKQNAWGFVYKIVNNINGKIYIGQTISSVKSRFNSHYNTKSKTSLIHLAMKKYGKENFSYSIVDVAFSKQDLDLLEIKHIKEYKSNFVLYNILGGGQYDKEFTKEARQKISLGLKGKPKSKEHVEKVRNANKGKKRSFIQIEQHRKRMCSLLGRKIVAVDLNGNILEYESINSAVKSLGIIKQAIRASLNSENVINKKYVFFYKEQFNKNVNYKSYFYNFYLKKEDNIFYYRSLREIFLAHNTSERKIRNALKTKKYLDYEFGVING